MKKRIVIGLGLVLALCLAFSTVVFATQATKQSDITYRSIKIVVNGTEIAPVDVNGTSTEPFILNSDGSTYLPVRAVGDALGLEVGWNGSTSTVILSSNGTAKISGKKPAATNMTKTATLTYRNITITLDGKKVALVNAKGEPVEPFIYNNSTYLPVRAVATALGCDIGWDGPTSTVSIKKEQAAPALKIIKEPKDATLVLKEGEHADFIVEAAGGVEPYTYQWQIKKVNTGEWKSINTPDAKTNRFIAVYGAGLQTGDQFRCIITDAAGAQVTSKICALTTDMPLTITKQPETKYLEPNKTTTLSVGVTGGTGDYTYLWQVYYQGKWKSPEEFYLQFVLKDYDTAVLNASATSYTTFFLGCPIRCVISDGESTVTSDQAFIYSPVYITKEPSYYDLDGNSTATFTVEVAGGTGKYTYEWQKNDGGFDEFTRIPSGNGSATLTVNARRDDGELLQDACTSDYRCVIKDSNGYTVISRDVFITSF